MRPQCKGPLWESGLQEGYSESRCASMDNRHSDLLYQGRRYYSVLLTAESPIATENFLRELRAIRAYTV